MIWGGGKEHSTFLNGKLSFVFALSFYDKKSCWVECLIWFILYSVYYDNYPLIVLSKVSQTTAINWSDIADSIFHLAVWKLDQNMVNIGSDGIGNVALKYEVEDSKTEKNSLYIFPYRCFLPCFSLYCFVNLSKSFSAAVVPAYGRHSISQCVWIVGYSKMYIN